MDSERMLDVLLNEHILEEETDGSSIRVTDRVRETLLERLDERESLDAAEIESTLTDAGVSADVRDVISDDFETRDDLFVVFRTLGDEVPLDRLDDHERLFVSLLVLQFFKGLPPADGAPDVFLPVSADLLPAFVRVQHKAIVYVWCRDCDPCDIVRGDLNDMLDEATDDIALYAVYGPDGPETLHDEYDVAGAPTTLFFLGGEVDARLVGAHQESVVENEIETLRALD